MILIDIDLDRLPGAHATTADFAPAFRAGGDSDWRLPSVEHGVDLRRGAQQCLRGARRGFWSAREAVRAAVADVRRRKGDTRTIGKER